MSTSYDSKDIQAMSVDSSLTFGYQATILIGKERTVSQVMISEYSIISLVRDVGGSALGWYFLLYFFIWVVPLEKWWNNFLLSQVYHVNHNENLDIDELKESLENQALLQTQQRKNSMMDALGNKLRQNI